MWPNPQETADLVTFTEENLNGKLQFLCSVVANPPYKDTQIRSSLSESFSKFLILTTSVNYPKTSVTIISF